MGSLYLVSVLFVGHRDEEYDEEAYCTGEEPESQSVEEHKSVILHLLSQLKLGMDLTKVIKSLRLENLYPYEGYTCLET